MVRPSSWIKAQVIPISFVDVSIDRNIERGTGVCCKRDGAREALDIEGCPSGFREGDIGVERRDLVIACFIRVVADQEGLTG